MSFLYEPGDLAQTPLAALLLEALNVRATGVLTVQQGGGASKLFLRAGVPAGAQVFVGFKPLGNYLLSQGLIEFDALDKSLQEMARTGRSQGQLLVEMGALSAAQLDRALAEQQAGYMAVIAALESGAYRFDADAPVPEWTRGVRLSPLKAIVDTLEKPQAEALVASALRQATGVPIALATGYGLAADAFGWSVREAALVGQLERPTSMEAFFSDARVRPERARAALAALLLLGYAEPCSNDTEPAARVPAGVIESHGPAAAHPQTAPAAAPGAEREGAPAQRSDAGEARARRQRLLAKAMQNMGIGPLSSRASPPPPGTAPAASPEAAPSATAPAARGGRAAPSAAEADLRRALDEAAPRALASDFFERLGLERDATQPQVKQAYLALAKQFHPDRFARAALSDLAPKVKELFTAVNEAYEVLSDDKKRADYLRAQGGGAGGGGSGAAQVDFKKGEACLKSRDFARARGFFEAAIRQDPRAEYRAALAWCYLVDPAQRDRQKAKDLVAEALKDPGCDRACYVCAVLLREENDEEGAERMFRAALKANPKHLDAEREIRLIEMRRKKGGGLFKKR